MKLFSLRMCLFMALALVIIVAVLSSGATDMMLIHSTDQAQQHSELVRSMVANSTHWTDPAWQQTIRSKFSAVEMVVVIRNTAGHVLFQSGTYNTGSPVYQEVLITDGIHPLGTASIYECTPVVFVTLYTVYAGLLALLLTLAAVVWFFTSLVFKPLTAITKATQKVARNELDFSFPGSRVREVADAFHSFTMMSEALRSSLVRQADVEQERRLLISAIAHDLRTPLFSLRGYLQGLSMGLANTPEKASRYIEVCQTKAAALERLIADLFAYTQLEYLEQMPCQEPLQVGELIGHVLESLAPQAQSKDVLFTIDSPKGPDTIWADAHLLIRVFENLLDNALRYTPMGGSIRISWYFEQTKLLFTISDTGPGISAADLRHLFTPLYRSDPSRNRRTGGAGLGLSIAQRILHAHGGSLTATNAVGGGAIFSGSLQAIPDQKVVEERVLEEVY